MQLLSLKQSDQASVPAVQAQAVTFTDVSVSHWANNYIKTLAEQGIITGFPDGSFRPDEPMTRSQFAAILQQAFALVKESSSRSFDDVPDNHWAADAIAIARAANFLLGCPGNMFKPEQNISRAQMLVSLVSGLGYNNTDSYAYYTDADEIPAYAQSSVAAATHRRLVVNHPLLTQLNPNRSATRAEVVASIYQALVEEGRANPLPTSPYLVIAAASHWPNKPITILPIQANPIGFDREGEQLAVFIKEDSASQNTPVSQSRFEVWNPQTGEQIASRTVDDSIRMASMAFSEDGSKIAAIVQTQLSHELTLLIWDLASDEPPISKLLGDASQLVPDGSGFAHLSSAQVAFGANDTLVLAQVQVGQFESTDTEERVVRIHRIDANGTLDEALQILTPTSNSRMPQFAFSSDGTLLAGISNVINVWRLDTGELLNTLEPKEKRFRFSSMAFTPTGALRTLAQGNPYEESLITWDLLAKTAITPSVDLPEVDRQDYTQLLSPDGIHHFMYGDIAGTRLLNVCTSQVTRLHTVRGSAVFNRTGSCLAIATPEGINLFSQTNVDSSHS
ncbi:MAG: S-layer homology domain-containing protein [Phormidesmis sp.]